MRPSERSIRNTLRQDAERVPIPQDMWEGISAQLDGQPIPARRRPAQSGRDQWRPAVALAVAAGFFWFALIPALPNMDRVLPMDSGLPPMVVPVAGSNDRDNTPMQATAGDFDTKTIGIRNSVAAIDPVQHRFPGPLKPQ